MPVSGDTTVAVGRQTKLQAEGVTVQFNGVRALDGVDVELHAGAILGLIGPNGAGKTTMTNVLSGFQRPTQGQVLLGGKDVTALAPHRRSRAGVARTFQGVRLFADLTVRENIEAAARRARGRARHELVERLLDTLRLQDRAEAEASSLPYGDERRLGIARALATQPSFLLLDEPAAGLNESESDELLDAILALRDEFGCGILVIEHDMRLIMRLCEQIQVLDSGRTIRHGTPAEVQADPTVRLAYLGTSGGDDARG